MRTKEQEELIQRRRENLKKYAEETKIKKEKMIELSGQLETKFGFPKASYIDRCRIHYQFGEFVLMFIHNSASYVKEDEKWITCMSWNGSKSFDFRAGRELEDVYKAGIEMMNDFFNQTQQEWKNFRNNEQQQ